MDWQSFKESLMEDLKPYRQISPTVARIPPSGENRENILEELGAIQARETVRWQSGRVSGAVYHGGQDHIDFLNKVYALYSQANPLHTDVWPSIAKFEAEIVSMAASMLNGEKEGEGRAGGVVTSGGTESILMAMKAYRDWGITEKGIRNPEMVIPVTAHAAYDKAARYFGLRSVRIPVDQNYIADIKAAREAVGKNTVVIVGSAPGFPHGTIDPIEDLGQIALENGTGCHVDACLGGFVLPWAERLGFPVPPFDFRVPGVTSISVDTHKYGYAPKGTSVILYRGEKLRHYQYYTITDWPGGLYLSPTMAGSRPGALSAACWAALVATGEEGYLEATGKILETAARIKEGIGHIPELHILGDPLWVIAFSSDEVDIYQVMTAMGQRGWSLNPLNNPPAVHIAVTLRHTQPGVSGLFLDDLRESVQEVKKKPPVQQGTAAIYGMASTLPEGIVQEALKAYLDFLYEV